MLEVLNLTKIYKTKGGTDVKALDNVSIRFPETGMVFLLGKSGSGKSTLLNVCGGLDAPTNGEIIVKGRSSKDFTQSDFDSYRNTYVGFIFQEYNILSEFSVEDNISLALELQGKPKDKASIAKLLQDVDLTGYAKRKPNTLSGGQKQRIAIARALIKAPEIIMADEPTGALDSATGKQVFDTLKKLSASKLVLVVSHDRDFAELYGDRVIELKDGKIISDVTKTQESQQGLSKNITAIGNILHIRNGAQLENDDFEKIKTFLNNSEGDVMIASGEKDVKAFKAVSRISDDGKKDVFNPTDETKISKKVYSSKDSQLIRSRLPLKHAAKIGVSGLKTKPFRLFFTILLSTVAFILFGVLSTMTFYNSDATFRKSLKDSSYEFIQLQKNYVYQVTSYYNGNKETEYTATNNTRFTEADLQSYTTEFGPDTFAGIEANIYFNVQTSSNYWKNTVAYFAYLPETNSNRSNLQGNYPTSDDEICISSYLANVIYNCKMLDNNNQFIDIDQPEDIIGKSIVLSNHSFKVTGIIKSGELHGKYDELKDMTEQYNWSLDMEMQIELKTGLHQTVFVTKNKLISLSSENMIEIFSEGDYYRAISVYTKKNNGQIETDKHDSEATYKSQSDMPSSVKYLFDKTSLSENEIAAESSFFYSRLHSILSDRLSDEFTQHNNYVDEYFLQINAIVEDYLQSAEDKNLNADVLYSLCSQWEQGSSIPKENDKFYDFYTIWKNSYKNVESSQATINNINEYINIISVLQNNGEYKFSEDGKTHEFIPLSEQQKNEYINALFTFVKENSIQLQLGIGLLNRDTSSTIGSVTTYNIVAVDFNSSNSNNVIYFTDSIASAFWQTQKSVLQYCVEEHTDYVEPEGAVYTAIFVDYDHSNEITERILQLSKGNVDEETDTSISINCPLINTLVEVNYLVEVLSKVFLYVGLVLALFAALLLSNFISVSISYKKREIGILRAVGARGVDVFKIFFSESFVITFICVILSTIGSILVCNFINTEIGASLGVSLFVFGVASFVVLFAIALLTSVVATFLPVQAAAKKKPVDSIRSL